MLSCLHAPVLNNGGQGIDHHRIGLQKPGSLLIDPFLKILLVLAEGNTVLYAAFHHHRLKRFHHNVGSAKVKGFNRIIRRILGGDHNDRTLSKHIQIIHLCQHLKPILLRHDQIQEHSGDLPVILF